MAIKNTLEGKITYRIKRSEASVFLRRDFEDLGGYDQVGRVLRQLIQKELLISIGYGLYARADQSGFFKGETLPDKPLPELGEEALKKLGFKIVQTEAERLYNEGKSTQVPTGRKIGIQGQKRISRRIGYDGKRIYFERHA